MGSDHWCRQLWVTVARAFLTSNNICLSSLQSHTRCLRRYL